MLAGGYHSLVFLIRATLEPINESRDVGRQVEDVFTRDFLSAAPAWVFKAIDVWGPEIETAPVSIVNARPSVLTTVATALMSSSLKAALMSMGWGIDVA